MNVQRIVRLVVAWSLLLTPIAAWAQTTQAGSIAGVARDTSGAVLPGVTVEAASPALIEKVRTVVTDDQGLYRVVDLRPGVYTVTFTLAGFSTFRREGIELTTGFTATVNAELQVGSLAETITVSGAAPVVDTQNIRQQAQFSRQTLEAIPGTGRLPGLYQMIPAAVLASAQTYSVGQVSERVASNFSVHGAPAGAPVVDGMNHISAGLTQGVVVYNQMNFQEVVVETSGIGADRDSGGLQVNIVPKEGSNTLSGSFSYFSSGPSLESSNFSDKLAARGVTKQVGLEKYYDVGASFGGPVKRDRLWFFGAFRAGKAQQVAQGNFWNKAQGTFIAPGVVAYEPDLSRPATSDDISRDYTARLTWQVAQKHKVSVATSLQPNCNCFFALLTTTGIIPAPEASGEHHYNPNAMPVASWTYTATNRLLIEGGASANIHHQTTKREPGVTLEHIPIVDQGRNIRYGARATSLSVGGSYSHNPRRIYQGRFAVSYVTGSHNLKTGINVRRFNEGNLSKQTITQHNKGGLLYTLNNGVPRFVQIWAVPHGFEESLRDVSIYGQDQWRIRRATVNLGLRYNDVRAWTPEQVLLAGVFIDERRVPAKDDVPHYRNVDPRVGVAYDLFGNSRTALKASLGRYADRLVSAADNPTRNMAPNTNRTWNDANRDLIPDCDLRNRVANGECGPWSDLNFGQQVPGTRLAADALEGTNKQFFNWQGAVGIQQELRQGIALNVGYFRTWYGGFLVTDNLAFTPADFDPYCITVATDSRLPTSGQQVCGFYDIKPPLFGQTDNLVTLASNLGDQTRVYNGVEMTLNGRLAGGAQFQGGIEIGRTVTDNCYVNDDPSLAAQGGSTTAPLNDAFCNVTPAWSAGTRFRGLFVYPLPWDLQTSVTYQDIPGIPISATYVASNAEIKASLGRDLGACRGAAVCNANVTVDLIPQDTLFEDRLRQLDIRFTRAFRLGGSARVRGNFDIYNIFNASNVLNLNTRYSRTNNQWLNAIQTIGGRLVKIGAQFDF